MRRWLPFTIGLAAAIIVWLVVFNSESPPRLMTELPEDLHYVLPTKWNWHGATGLSEKRGWVRLPELPADTGPVRSLSFDPRKGHYVGPEACAQCHQAKFDGYIETAHFKTSSRSTQKTVLGSFEDGKNRLETRDKRIHFEMEEKPDGFYQTAYLKRDKEVYVHSERMDIVTGSGNHGQTSLFWKDDYLYELPVTYFNGSDRWVNSPGYLDGTVDFARPVNPVCLECHVTYFKHVLGSENRYVKSASIFGVSCERCHGPGSLHVEYHQKEPNVKTAKYIVHPGNLPRDRLNEVCAQCHSGTGTPLVAPFSFRPGLPLARFKKLEPVAVSGRSGVHTANQYARLVMSRCFKESDDMTCATCHNPHRNEHGKTLVFSKRCQKCHDMSECGMCVKLGDQGPHDCVECHMPVTLDTQVELQVMSGSESPEMRDHFIRVLPGKSFHR